MVVNSIGMAEACDAGDQQVSAVPQVIAVAEVHHVGISVESGVAQIEMPEDYMR